jgi:branched-chain amino acid transport system permease protein
VAKFIELSASGIAYGAVLSIVSLGFVVLYKATGVMNFAHGDLVTLGAYLAFWARASLGLPTVAAYVLAIGMLLVVGVAIERVAYAPLRRRSPTTVIVATLAAAIVIEGAISVWQGATPKSLASPVGNRVFGFLGADIPDQDILIVVVGVVLIAALILMFQKTTFGRSVRALAADPETAQLQGVRIRVVSMIAFGLSAALAAVAGVLIGPLTSIDVTFGFNLMVTAFAAAVLGGFGSVGGVILGSILIGLVQQVIGGYLTPSYSTTLPFVALLLVIMVRPSGLRVLQRTRL